MAALDLPLRGHGGVPALGITEQHHLPVERNLKLSRCRLRGANGVDDGAGFRISMQVRVVWVVRFAQPKIVGSDDQIAARRKKRNGRAAWPDLRRETILVGLRPMRLCCQWKRARAALRHEQPRGQRYRFAFDSDALVSQLHDLYVASRCAAQCALLVGLIDGFAGKGPQCLDVVERAACTWRRGWIRRAGSDQQWGEQG